VLEFAGVASPRWFAAPVWIVQYQQAGKIDLSAEYPCPCSRRGCLRLIALTEAFGCDRCQKIFALEANGEVIEQLSCPYKKTYRWSGQRWLVARPDPHYSFPAPVALFCRMLVAGFVLAGVLWALRRLGVPAWVCAIAGGIVIASILLWRRIQRR